MTDSTWHLWLEPLRLRELDDRCLTLVAPGDTRQWVADRFGRLLRACSGAVLGDECTVEVVGDCDTPEPPTSPRGRSRASDPRGTPPAAPRAQTDRPGGGFDPRLTFDQFVIGDTNRLAHAAALAVAELPALAYNPLFICGPPGLGKTHLLHSIANYVTAYGEATCRYTTVESFTNHFVASLHGGGIDAFKDAYRGVDVLLVDDVQFLQRKVKTEEEFFHTFNALHASGAQIVLTSDRLPRDMDALEDRLRERFEAGLVCDVRAPDYETRLTILRKRVQQDGIADADPCALELIARRVQTNVRALEGALIRIIAFGSLTRRPLTAELADEVLDGLYPAIASARPGLERIQEIVAREWDISVTELVSSSRAAPVTQARQVAMHLVRELTDLTLPTIGRAFGGRNHTTVLHACRRITERRSDDPALLSRLDQLHRELGDPRADRSA